MEGVCSRQVRVCRSHRNRDEPDAVTILMPPPGDPTNSHAYTSSGCPCPPKILPYAYSNLQDNPPPNFHGLFVHLLWMVPGTGAVAERLPAYWQT
jgi:hypothetical protein